MSYGQGSIKRLKGEETVRKRPTVIFGTDNEDGAFHSIYEIIANSIDEARQGYGNRIEITVEEGNVITVSDDGRGVPMDYNPIEKKYNWELVFCTLYASGKYDAESYTSSVGLNGLGATATQYASEFFIVESTRDGKTHRMEFKKGKPVGELQVLEPVRDGTGTKITFKPDSEVFVGIHDGIKSPSHYINLLRRQAMLHDGLEIVFTHHKLSEPVVMCYPKGVEQYVNEMSEHSILSNTPVFTSKETGTDDERQNPQPYEVTMRLAFNFAKDGNGIQEMYHNGAYLFEQGKTHEAMMTGFLLAFEERAKAVKKLKPKEKLSPKDIESVMLVVGETNAPANRTSYKNQTKGAVNNQFIADSVKNFARYSLVRWLESDKHATRAITEVLANKKAREEAEKLRVKVVQSLSKPPTTIGTAPKKFVGCESKDPKKKELYIVEGDSALGSCKLARDSAFQALIPVRGKSLNCLKAELTDILSNEVIVDILRVLGCGIEAKSRKINDISEFDINKLEYGKIILCTDADEDGRQIRCLLLTVFYRLCPTLLKKGKVYIAETPLFEINYKTKTLFAYTTEEKDEIVADLLEKGATKAQIKIQRSKGLGENDPEMMSKTTMNPKTRRLVKVEFDEDMEEVSRTFEVLLGNDLEARKQCVMELFTDEEADDAVEENGAISTNSEVERVETDLSDRVASSPLYEMDATGQLVF